MYKTKKVLLVLIIIIISLCVLLFVNGIKENNGTMIMIDGFELKYVARQDVLSIDDFVDLELGISMKEIIENVGEPDEWIGSGVLSPVYFVEGKQAIVCYFKYPGHFKGLKKIVVYNENGEKYTLKEVTP